MNNEEERKLIELVNNLEPHDELKIKLDEKKNITVLLNKKYWYVIMIKRND